ncbi:MAG: molybdopterin cofactor-binding domain-containing protein, partial [Streptosporangiales bacterium]
VHMLEPLAAECPLVHGVRLGEAGVHVTEVAVDFRGDVAGRDAVYEGTFGSQRLQHVHLETHAAIGWMDGGRLVLRTSSQTPFLTRDELCRIYGLDRSQVRVFTARIGGGFGGKQEMLTEDVVGPGRAAARPAGPAGAHP